MPTPRRFAKRHLTTLLLFMLYISPALAASGAFIAYNRARLTEVTRQLVQEARTFREGAPESQEKDPIWLQYLIRQRQEAGQDRDRFVAQVQEYIEQQILGERFQVNALAISLLTLLPFSLLGLGFAARRNDDEPLSQVAVFALRHWGLKLHLPL